MAEYSYFDYGDIEPLSDVDINSLNSLDNSLETALKNTPLDENNGPRAGGVMVEKSCCGVPVVQSEGAHDMGNGMYVGGVIVNYCPKCHKPYHSPVIGSSQ